jgi:Domain of unknown function (DUF6484)
MNTMTEVTHLADADHVQTQAHDDSAVDLLSPLLQASTTNRMQPRLIHGVLVGELIALSPEGSGAYVRHAQQALDEGALQARSMVDLHAMHIGAQVVLMFDQGDPQRPLVMGILRSTDGWPLAASSAQVQVDFDGQRLVVNAKEQLVLRCGKASITLTKAGKVLIEGSYLLSRSTGVNRIKGGSVQLN